MYKRQVLTLLFFFVAPMVYILVHTLHENGLSDFVDFFGDPFYRNILWVTLRVSLVSTAISLVLGYPTAFYMARTKSRDRKSTRLNSSHLKLSRMPSSA